MSAKKAICVCAALLGLSVLASCGGSVESADANPCSDVLHEIQGQIVPKTSELSCDGVKGLINAVPSSSGVFLLQSASPKVVWRCDLELTGPVILTCRHKSKEFFIRRVGSGS